MIEYRVKDFIPYYPESSDDSLQRRLAAKKEFEELSSFPQDKNPSFESNSSNDKKKCFNKERYFDHQLVVLRLLEHYPKILLIAETGTGKSCSFIAPSEMFRKCFAGIYHQAYILENNITNCEEFIKQVLTKCSKGSFETRREALKWYKPMTYEGFVKHELCYRTAAGEYVLHPDHELIRKFSGCLFLIDEAHNLRGSDKNVKEEDLSKFEKLRHLFNVIKRFKLIIATATPMFNSPEEIIKIAELLSGEEIVLPKNFDWEGGDISALLSDSIRGKVSYIRGADTGVDIEYVGEKIPKPNDGIYSGQLIELKRDPLTIVVPLEIKKDSIQYKTLKLLQKNEEEVSQPFLNKEINSFSFVFPTLTLSEEGVYKRFIKNEAVGGKKKYKFSDERVFFVEGKNKLLTLREYLSDFERLKNVSVKIAFILKCELKYALQRGAIDKNYYLERFNIDLTKDDFPFEYSNGDQGNSFIYTTQLSQYGAQIIGMIFELYGWEMYTRSGTILDSNDIPLIPKKLRFGLHTGNPNYTSNNPSLLSLFNSDANRHGDYVQTYIGSRISREAISLGSVTRGYLYTPDWHESGNHQAMSRFIRATSHNSLTAEKGARVIVKVYNLCAYICPSDEENSLSPSEGSSPSKENPLKSGDSFDGSVYSIDIKLYLIAELKDFKIRRVMRFLKVNAVDCLINYDRNVRLTDKDFTKECDYNECLFTCADGIPLLEEEMRKNLALQVEMKQALIGNIGMAGGQGPTLDEIDFTTYDILYSEDTTFTIEEEILKLIIVKGILTFSEIIEYFSLKYFTQFHKKSIERYIFEAIDRRIESKIPFTDTYGYKCYLQTDGTHIFIQRDFPRRDTFLEENSSSSKSKEEDRMYGQIGYYSTQLIGRVPISLLESAEIIKNSRGNENKRTHPFNVEKLNSLSGEKILESIFSSEYSEKNRIDLFEEQYFSEGKVSKVLKEYYSPYYFEFNEPTKGLRDVSAQLNTIKQGNQSKNLKDRSVDFSLVDTSFTGEKVVIHCLYQDKDSKDYERTIYFRASQTKDKMRVVIPSQSKEWKKLNDAEFKLYPKLFEENHLLKIKDITRKTYYGIIYYSGRNEEIFAIASNEVKKDKRENLRGGRCTTKSLADIIRFILNENLNIPEENPSFLPPSKKVMRGYLDERKFTYTDETLEKVYVTTILSENKIPFTQKDFISSFKWYKYFTREPAPGESKHQASLKNRISEMCNVFYTIYSEEARIVRYPYI